MNLFNKINQKITLAVGTTIVFIGGVLFFWRRQPALNSEVVLENSEEFQQAARNAKKLSGLGHADQLLLYGLYKQATIGDCNVKEPMRLHLQDHAKWVAWMACKGIQKDQAEQQYIRHVQKYMDSGVAMNDSQQSQQMGMRVSTMKQGEHETNEAYIQKMNTNNQQIEQIQLSEEEKQQFDQIVANLDNPEELQELLKQGNEFAFLQYESEQKIKLIHNVVDSENMEALQILLPRYAHYKLVNIQESVSGMTALHYACLSGNKTIVEQLLMNGADPHIKDFSGQDCFQTIDKENREWLV